MTMQNKLDAGTNPYSELLPEEVALGVVITLIAGTGVIVGLCVVGLLVYRWLS